MIQMQTEMVVADNSGAKIFECIKILGGSKKTTASIGEIVVGSIKSIIPQAKVKKGEVIRAVIVRIASPIKRKNGITVRFNDNAVILLNKQNLPIGTRVHGPIPSEIREVFPKIWSLTKEHI